MAALTLVVTMVIRKSFLTIIVPLLELGKITVTNYEDSLVIFGDGQVCYRPATGLLNNRLTWHVAGLTQAGLTGLNKASYKPVLASHRPDNSL